MFSLMFNIPDKKFINLWGGYSFLLITMKITAFALSFHVMKETKSIVYFTYIVLAGTLPNIFLLPLTSFFIDKYEIKKVALYNSCLMLIFIGILAYAVAPQNISISLLCFACAGPMFCLTMHIVLFDKAITKLVKKDKYNKAISMTKISNAMSYLMGPALAGFLITYSSMHVIVLFGLFSVILNIILIAIYMPVLKKEAANIAIQININLFNYLKDVWLNNSLKWLLISFAASFFWMNIVNTLFVPILIEQISIKNIGYTLSIASFGILIGYMILYIVKFANNERINYYFLFLLNICLLMLGLIKSNLLLYGSVLFFGNIFCSLIQGLNQNIVQETIEFDRQGRFFLLRNVLSYLVTCISYILAGPINNYFIKPLLTKNSDVFSWVVYFLGEGNAASIKFIFLIFSILFLCYLCVKRNQI